MLTIPQRQTPIHRKQKRFGNHEEYIARITKSLYYVKLPPADCTSLPVTELAAEIFSETKSKFSLDYLDIEEAANLSHYACVSPCSLVLALLYLDRLKTSNPKYLAKVSPSELFLISLMVGSKFLQDDGEEDEVNNCEWAASAGLTVHDVNKAEKKFLDAIKWEVYVSEKEFWKRLKLLECKVNLREGCKRGWFTYSELNLLLDLIDFTYMMQSIWTVTTACLTSYTASVLALVGSAILVGQIPGLGLKGKVPAANECQNWNSTSPCTIDSIIIDMPTQDCSVISYLDRLNDTDVISDISCDTDLEKESPDCAIWNPFSSFSINLSPIKLQDISRALVANLKVDNDIKLFGNPGYTWKWTDAIKNYLLKDSVPTILFPIASF